jgi:hypothetical protein
MTKTEIERDNPFDLKNPLSQTGKEREGGRTRRQLDAIRNTAQQRQKASIFDVLARSSAVAPPAKPTSKAQF